MRLLLTILLFPILCKAQFSAGMAQYTAYCAPKFGVLVNSSTLSNSAKANITKDTLKCNYARTAITCQSWTGSSTRFETYDAKGLKQSVVINYQAGNPNPFTTAAQLTGYKDTLTLIAVKYPQIYAVVVENEEQNDTYHSPAIFADYVNMVIANYQVFHPRGIKVTDGGTYGSGLDIKVYRWLVTKYNQAAADQYGAATMTNAQINAAKTPDSNPTLELRVKQLDTVYDGIKDYVDYLNVHGYETFQQGNTRPDTLTQVSLNVRKYQKEYLEETYKRPVVSNEYGIRDNTQTVLIANMMTDVYNLGFFELYYYDGTGGAGAQPITDDITGAILPTGTVYKNFIIAHQQNGQTGLP